MAEFVARQLLASADLRGAGPIRVLDPAVGDGALLRSLLEQLAATTTRPIEAYGFETDPVAHHTAATTLQDEFPSVRVVIQQADFLAHVLQTVGMTRSRPLFPADVPSAYDLIIANPPYVRTEVMGAAKSRLLAKQFCLSGRVDLYHAFVIALARVLDPNGTAGFIVSNRFMTTKSGADVRSAIRGSFGIEHVWDLGDTKLFDAAVLPAVLLLRGPQREHHAATLFTSIYESREPATLQADDSILALQHHGVVETLDGRKFNVRHGLLSSEASSGDVWRLTTGESDAWLETVAQHTWGTFSDVGKVRVGVKTCADSVFIRSDWGALHGEVRPELLRSLTTRHIARRFRANTPARNTEILYPHLVIGGRSQVADLANYPHSRRYFESHKQALAQRKYVTRAGKQWYEVWVHQDPGAWDSPKLVFLDIAERPTFWVDLDNTVVNGDCYWIAPQSPNKEILLWLAAAVGNSTFIEKFYDHRFHNKLYSGRRRFITQYVRQFPLPDPTTELSVRIVSMAKEAYASIGTDAARDIESVLNSLVWAAFGLSGIEECAR